VALAVDGTAKYSDRRHAQNAADASALASALLKANGSAADMDDDCRTDSGWSNTPFCVDLIDTAWDRAEENGYDGSTPNSVDVYSPPISGPYLGNTAYVQVMITSYVNTFFARIIGIAQTRNLVEAVALTGRSHTLGDGAMIISYDPDPNCSTGGTGGYSVQVSGSSTVNLDGGGFLLNSDEVCGFKIPNCADLNMTGGAGINSVGAANINTEGCTFDPPIDKNFNEDPIAIPDDVIWPDVPPECSQLATAYPVPPGQDQVWHITPGYYSDFPQSNINGDIVGNKKDIIMDPGVYCVGKSIHWSGNTFDSLDGSSGVTIYLKSGFDFNFSINSPIKLYASDSGDYQGYLIIQKGTPTSHGSCTINGGLYLDMKGLIYAPYCNIKINGGSDPTAEINAQLIGWDILINGTTTINFNYDPSNQVKIKRKVGLMR